MRRTLSLVALLLAFGLTAGCVARGQDPFAYTRKPLYWGAFDLGEAPMNEKQEFRVEDGSIASVRIWVWVNATAGSARVEVWDPSGTTVVDTSETMLGTFTMKPGVWTVRATSDGNASGRVSLLAMRG